MLVLGAGGTGGYFGGRLADTGADVTFWCAARGRHCCANAACASAARSAMRTLAVATVTVEDLAALPPFDLVVLSCKAYDLDGAIAAIAPAVGPDTAVLPILNGLLHYDALDARFGRARVLGGLCFISATLGADGAIVHMGRPASLTFGLREGNADAGVLRKLAAACAAAGVDHLLAPDIARAQWIKFSFMAALAAGTCLMRASVGGIVASEGARRSWPRCTTSALAVAAAEGQPVAPDEVATARGHLTRAGSTVTASMLRDLQAGARVEALQIVGDMVHRAHRAGLAVPRLAAAWVHLQAYEATRAAG